MHQDPEKKLWPFKRVGQTYLLVLEVRGFGSWRDKDTGKSISGEYSLMWALQEATISSLRPGPAQWLIGSSGGMPQAKQSTRQEHRPTYLQTGWLKSSWAQPCPSEGKDTVLPTSGQKPVTTGRKPTQTCQIASSTREQPGEARTTILQPVEQKPQSQKVIQNETAEEYVPDEGTR